MPESNSSTDRVPAGHVIVGHVGKPHGLAGAVYVRPETDNPNRFAPSAALFVDGRPTTVVSSHDQEDRLLVRFEGVNDRVRAEGLRGSVLTILEDDRRELDPDEWWPEQLVGLKVMDHDDVERGVVVAVVEGVAQDRLVIDVDGGQVEVPFVKDLVPEVDVGRGIVRLGRVEGLLTES